ncbi:2Fe-2S iron-sulfur cluster-binding protein [Brevibacillus humidisoli]|uniref:2Fe-2S iron-sulfur cluster-binding protein n=1 Tax=Brevibacillus humidisoli TaxID=2895522 RepID=UPI001E502B9B|nr:2Fe-2S iron-sulfur cluster-binding protein [Brevibacillus humidisoli]UFJ42796.1 2Fe-2S iron-sulfur cluster-binding protein [Brevibacillus humidisoli]
MAKVTFLPSGKIVKGRSGQSLISLARSARVVIPQRCGGHASCHMCKVSIDQGTVSPPTILERRKMREADLNAGIRLACQTRLTDTDCTVRLHENKLKSVVAAALEREKQQQSEDL